MVGMEINPFCKCLVWHSDPLFFSLEELQFLGCFKMFPGQLVQVWGDST